MGMKQWWAGEGSGNVTALAWRNESRFSVGESNFYLEHPSSVLVRLSSVPEQITWYGIG